MATVGNVSGRPVSTDTQQAVEPRCGSPLRYLTAADYSPPRAPQKPPLLATDQGTVPMSKLSASSENTGARRDPGSPEAMHLPGITINSKQLRAQLGNPKKNILCFHEMSVEYKNIIRLLDNFHDNRGLPAHKQDKGRQLRLLRDLHDACGKYMKKTRRENKGILTELYNQIVLAEQKYIDAEFSREQAVVLSQEFGAMPESPSPSKPSSPGTIDPISREQLKAGGVTNTDLIERNDDIKHYLLLGVPEQFIGYCLKYSIPDEQTGVVSYEDLPDLVKKDDHYWEQFAKNAKERSTQRPSAFEVKQDRDQSEYGGTKDQWLSWVDHTVDEAIEMRTEKGSASLDQIDQFIATSRAKIAEIQGTEHAGFGNPRAFRQYLQEEGPGPISTVFPKHSKYCQYGEAQYERYRKKEEEVVFGRVEALLFGRKQILTGFMYKPADSDEDSGSKWYHPKESPHLIKLHCRTLFQEAMMENIGSEKLIDVLAELVYFRAHMMEWYRGSASITEQLLRYIAQSLGGSIEVKDNIMLDCIALTKPNVEDFKDAFKQAVTVNITSTAPQETTNTQKLCNACRSGNLEEVQHLLQSRQFKAEPIDSIKDAAGYSLLHIAALYGKEQLVEHLVKAGADPNLATDSGETPILLAATKGNSQAISTLLDHGATVEPIPTIGVSALHIAAGTIKDTAVIKKMVEKGASALIRDCSGYMPADFAEGAGNTTVYNFLQHEHFNLPDNVGCLKDSENSEFTQQEDGMQISDSANILRCYID